MNRLPAVSWKDVARALEASGFIFDRQRGSHRVYYHPQTQATVTVPQHPAIKKGTLVHIIKQSGMTREEFIAPLTKS